MHAIAVVGPHTHTDDGARVRNVGRWIWSWVLAAIKGAGETVKQLITFVGSCSVVGLVLLIVLAVVAVFVTIAPTVAATVVAGVGDVAVELGNLGFVDIPDASMPVYDQLLPLYNEVSEITREFFRQLYVVLFVGVFNLL